MTDNLPVKNKGGRPKGSLNKATLEKNAMAVLAKEAINGAVLAAVKCLKDAVVKDNNVQAAMFLVNKVTPNATPEIGGSDKLSGAVSITINAVQSPSEETGGTTIDGIKVGEYTDGLD